MKKFALLVLAALSLSVAIMRESMVFASTTSKAAGFELKDQYNKPACFSFPRSKITVLTFGDRKGAEQIEGWVRPLWEKYQDRIDQQGIAVLSSVPRLARGMVRMIFKTQIKYSVLLDWKGDVSKAYGFSKGAANLYIIDRGGSVIFKTVGPADQNRLNEVFRQIDQLLP
jgi:hypothetical protein